MNHLNLDKVAAKTAQDIVSVIGKPVEKENKKTDPKNTEILITKTLGVLQEQGVYAVFLFLLSRSGNKTTAKELKEENLISCYIVYHLLALLNDPILRSLGYAYSGPPEEIQINTSQHKNKGILPHLTKDNGLLDHLDHLLLIKELYEQTLIYARFGAKAAGKGE